MGPEYSLPWFKLTREAVALDYEENEVYAEYREELVDRLRRFILMSGEKRLPVKVIKGMQWYLGLPDSYLDDPDGNLGDRGFRVVEMGDGVKGLAVVEGNEERVLSVIQRNVDELREEIAFPLFPTKGLRLKRKISDWFDEFQRVKYVSPYEDYSGLDTDSDVSEKRVVGVLHELLSLFVEHAAERRKLLCLRKYLGFPQKVHRVFERHPYIFYLSLRNKTCTAILKQAYCGKLAIEEHPLAKVRRKYIRLVKESSVILKNRRGKNRFRNDEDGSLKMALDCEDDCKSETAEDTL